MRINMETKNPVQSAERIYHVLETLSKTGPSELKELSQRLDLHKSTVHRLLSSLICMGYAAQDEETGKYMLTFKVVEISQRVLDRTGILPLAHPVVKRLARKSGETAHLVQRSGDKVVYIDKVESDIEKNRTIRMTSQIGLEREMYYTGVGKALMAEMPEDEARRIFESSKLEKKTSKTIVTFDEMKKELISFLD